MSKKLEVLYDLVSFLVVFDNISYPNSVFTPISKFSTLAPHTKHEVFQNFVKFNIFFKNSRRKGMALKFSGVIPFIDTNSWYKYGEHLSIFKKDSC